MEPIPSAHSRGEQDEEAQPASENEGDSSETSSKAMEHGSKAAQDVNAQKKPFTVEETSESASGRPSSSKPTPMAPPSQRTPSTSTLAKPKLNDLGLPIRSSLTLSFYRDLVSLFSDSRP